VPNTFSVTGSSDIGRIRRRNEDAIALIPELGIAVVADGMGGHPGGDVASRIAADSTAAALREAVTTRDGSTPFDATLLPLVEQAVVSAHERIRERGTEEPGLDGMGTTLTAMALDGPSGTFVIGHVGDSRAYRLRAGVLTQLTRDDTWVQQQIDSGRMPPSAARSSPYAHLLTQCLGLEDAPTPQVLSGIAESGDAYLLCTDGLVGMLEDDAMSALLAEQLSANGAGGDGAIDALLAAANEAGGHDNITAALVRFD
jgi:protein phosphatase